MHPRDHNWEDGFHHRGETYLLVARRPGAHRITVPCELHFLDIHLGKSTASYKISGTELISSPSSPSSFVFLPAGSEREIHASRSGWSVQMTFDPEALHSLLSRMLARHDKRLEEQVSTAMLHLEDNALIGIAQTLTSIWAQQLSAPSPDQIDAAAKLFVVRIAYNLLQRQIQTPVQSDKAATRIQAVLNHIEDNLSDPLSLDVLASIANLSTYHFARVFRETVGRSPRQYIVERRLAHAKRKLYQTDEAIAAIAHDCGFSSQSHMTGAFKKVLGVTPGAIRRNGG